MVHGGLVSWMSHKQMTVAFLFMEVEYMALSDASREAIARSQFFQIWGIPSTLILILSDSETALELANGTDVNHQKAKHIDIRYHTIRHFIQEEKVQVNHISNCRHIHQSPWTSKTSTPCWMYGREKLVWITGKRGGFLVSILWHCYVSESLT